jgi:hypothetical protein
VHGGDLRDITRLPRGNSAHSRRLSGQPWYPQTAPHVVPDNSWCPSRVSALVVWPWVCSIIISFIDAHRAAAGGPTTPGYGRRP